MDAHVARQLDRALVRHLLEPVEVDAGLHLDAARGDAEVDRDRGAELERRLDLVDAARADTPMAKKPPPPSSDTVRLNGCSRVEKLNLTETGFESNGRLNAAPSEAFDSAKMPTPIEGSVSE